MSQAKQCPLKQMIHIDPSSLNGLTPRVSYLKSFLDFTGEDGAAVQAAGPVIAPLLPTILDIVYTHLLSYDITAKSFAPHQSGQGKSPSANISELTLEHPNIMLRKDFLKGYLVRMVSNSDWSDNSNYWEYLDRVGVMHTGAPGFKHREKRVGLRVEYVHMALLLGFVEDVVVKTVLGADLDADTKHKVCRAFNKLLWIQNDLFARHYTIDKDAGSKPDHVEVHKQGYGTQLQLSVVAASIGGLITGVALASKFC